MTRCSFLILEPLKRPTPTSTPTLISNAHAHAQVGLGCFLFHPVIWVEENHYIDKEQASRVWYGYFELRQTMMVAFYVALGLGVTAICCSGAAIRYYNRKEAKFKSRIYLD